MHFQETIFPKNREIVASLFGRFTPANLAILPPPQRPKPCYPTLPLAKTESEKGVGKKSEKPRVRPPKGQKIDFSNFENSM